MGVSEENNASFSVGYNEVYKKDGGKLICIKCVLVRIEWSWRCVLYTIDDFSKKWILPKKVDVDILSFYRWYGKESNKHYEISTVVNFVYFVQW